MINKNLKDNWLQILNFNATREIMEEPEKKKLYVRLPFSPISINANLLYQLFEVLYPKFINDQQNILDIIISDTEKKCKILGLYLYKTKKAGIHESVESLPNNLIRIKNLDTEKMDDVFNNIQNQIIKEKKIHISSIRLFRTKAIDLINEKCKGIDEISIHEFLERSMDLTQKIINQDLVLIYPEPIVIKFLRKSLTLLDNIRLPSLFNYIEEILPEFNLSLLINGSGIKIIIHLQKNKLKSGKSHLTINLLTPDDLGININNSNLKNILISIQQKLKTENVYYINQNDVLSYITDFFELLVSVKKENILFLLQKALFGYRSFENHWNMIPRPKIYNTFVRFVMRLFGYNLNLKKISHWAIPELIFNYIDFYFGLNSRIVIMITDIKRNKTGKKSQINNFNSKCDCIFIMEFEESTLKKIIPIKKEEIFSGKVNSLYSLKEKISENYGTPFAVILFDKLLLENFIKNFIFGHSKLSFFPRFKTLRMLKDERLFMISPEFPFFKLIKKKRTMALIKLLLPILIDKHEF